jgi:serine/threonine-protein kinase
MSITVEQFIERLTQSGLMSAAEVSTFQDGLPPDKRPKDVQQLAQALVQRGKLTKFQAQTVYQGKTAGLVFGQYVVLDKLGEGGMGVVLMGRHRRMKRLVAIKVLSPAAMKQAGATERFHREVEAAAKLSHPNIVRAYDADEHQGMHYLVMEYVEGEDLATVVKEHGPLPVGQAVECILQAARGLHYAHDKGIVHRDIKPANLLLDKEGTVKILDMGLARITGADAELGGAERLTTTGQAMGTCDYMAPEQSLDTHQADARADIYSLGCTLYRLLTGNPPYRADSFAKLFLMHLESPIPSLCQARPEVPEALDAICRRMLAKKPEDRYQSMADVAAELEALLGVLPGQSGMATPAAKEKAKSSSAALSRTSSFVREETPVVTATGQRQATPEDPTQPQIGPEHDTASKGKGDKSNLPDQPSVGAHPPDASRTLDLAAFAHLSKARAAVAKVRRKPLLLAGLAGGLVLLLGIVLAITLRHGDAGPRANSQSSPPLAVAPFDAQQARKHQEAWAKHLGLPVEITNSIGMKLALIPPGEFMMGSHDGPKNEQPAHKVVIRKAFYLGKYKVTVAQFRQFAEATKYRTEAEQYDNGWANSGGQWGPVSGVNWRTPQFSQQDDHPVCVVSWKDTEEFCRWVSRQTKSTAYLPTEAQWEYACRAGTTTRFYTGDDDADLEQAAWYNGNSGSHTHPVGEKKPNAWGLYDMYGNLHDMVQDYFSADYYAGSPLADPQGPPKRDKRLIRGGGWGDGPHYCSSAGRHVVGDEASIGNGFRIAAEISAGVAPTAAVSGIAPPPAVAPFDPLDAKEHQEGWAKHLGVRVEIANSIGMKLVLIPPGEFDMGSTSEEVAAEIERAGDKGYVGRAPAEAPRHRVKITKPFYLAMHQVTQDEYESVTGLNPSAFTEKQMDTSVFKPPLSEADVAFRLSDGKKMAGKDASRCPVESVTWDDCAGFCNKLSAIPLERAARRVYRLPTEAEFEYACRAGTTTRWHSGDDEAGLDDVAWSHRNSGGVTHPVGEKKPNAWGLFEMHGNVEQWCADWFSRDYYQQSPPSDPRGAPAGSSRVLRGGTWRNSPSACRSAFRDSQTPAFRSTFCGFRVVADAVAEER